jgi:PIN domain nuclease of toxin-antitoxin system
MQFVLDACAMIAFLRDEAGAEVVQSRLASEPPVCLAHAVNLCEVFYHFLGEAGEDAARRSLDDLRAVGLTVREDMDEAFWQQVGRHKVQYRMSLADAFALSLADRFGAELLTSDRGDFEQVSQSAKHRVTFIR